MSVALVFFLIIADNVLLFTLSFSIIFSKISSDVKLANSGLIETFLLYNVFKSLHKQVQFDVVCDTVETPDVGATLVDDTDISDEPGEIVIAEDELMPVELVEVDKELVTLEEDDVE